MKELSIGVLIRIGISYYFVTDLVENLMTAEMYYMCLNVETLLSLFDTCVAGILNYDCKVWGGHSPNDVKKFI